MLFLGFVSSVFLLGRIGVYKQYTPQQTFLLGWRHLQVGNKPCLYLLLLLLCSYHYDFEYLFSAHSLEIGLRAEMSQVQAYVVCSLFGNKCSRENRHRHTINKHTTTTSYNYNLVNTYNHNFIQLQPSQRIKTIYHVISTHLLDVLNIIFISFVLANSKISVILRQFL